VFLSLTASRWGDICQQDSTTWRYVEMTIQYMIRCMTSASLMAGTFVRRRIPSVRTYLMMHATSPSISSRSEKSNLTAG
jgi:hypothetical protein